MKIISVLSFLGFTPVNVGHLPLVFFALWILVITTFSPTQLLIGLPSYIIVFPITALGALLFRKVLKNATPVTKDAPTPEPVRHFPVTSLSTALLVGWFVLYGGSSARGPNLVGFFLSLALFGVLVYQALDRTSPIEEHDAAFFSRAAVRGLVMVTNLFAQASKEPPKTRMVVASNLKIHGFLIGGFRRLGHLIHGRKGRERIARLMLLEYIFFLVVVAFSAILFWALAIKAVVPSEQALSLTAALRISASHFLPGIQDSFPTSLPWWTTFGPALTSWVLFVVYIGPVGSALPVQQDAFLKGLAPSQDAFRLIGRVWRLYRKFLKAVEKDLPQ